MSLTGGGRCAGQWQVSTGAGRRQHEAPLLGDQTILYPITQYPILYQIKQHLHQIHTRNNPAPWQTSTMRIQRFMPINSSVAVQYGIPWFYKTAYVQT
jgi:hypothetical protein